ncbi:hypothetical protein [Rhizorhabdus argentea]
MVYILIDTDIGYWDALIKTYRLVAEVRSREDISVRSRQGMGVH